MDAVMLASESTPGLKLPFVGEASTKIPTPEQDWEQLAECRSFLEKHERELRLIREAANMKGAVRFPADFSFGLSTVLTYTQQARQVARILALDAHVSAHDGNFSQAKNDVLHIIALADALRYEPTLISQLVQMAIRSIAYEVLKDLTWHCDWNADDITELQTAVAGLDIRLAMLTALQGERGVYVSALEQTTIGPFRQSNVREGLRFFDAMISGIESSWPMALEESQRLSTELNAMSNSGIKKLTIMGVLLLMPSMEHAISAGARAVAKQRATYLLLAARIHQLRADSIPDNLQALEGDSVSAEMFQEMSRDPFNGQPLRYVNSSSTLSIYSIAENGIDDGGFCDYDEEKGPPKDAGITVSLPD